VCVCVLGGGVVVGLEDVDSFCCHFSVYFRSVERRCEMAVSASRARFWIQTLGLSCGLNMGPFCSRAISGSQNDMLVMFATLG